MSLANALILLVVGFALTTVLAGFPGLRGQLSCVSGTVG
jgi:hypothetical protein